MVSSRLASAAGEPGSQGLESSRPPWSRMVTRSASIPSTLPATRCEIPSTTSGLGERPLLSLSTTEASGGWAASRKLAFSSSARCTCADSMPCIVPIVRSSSPSSARR
jgi:hypothetical protein